MKTPIFVKIKDEDNVAIAVREIKQGTEVMEGVTARHDIPQAHKIALCDIPKDQPVIRYGVVLGYAIEDIQKGDWINEFMLHLPTPPDVDDMKFATNLVTELPDPPVTTWEGYVNPWGGPAGTRNILGISTTVQCVTGVLNVAVDRMKKELLPKYPNVDDIVPINHAYGCGVAINAPEAKVPIRALRNLSKHPNFGGQLMVVGLGCEKFTVDMLCEKADITPENVIILQEKKGFDAMIDALMEMADKKLAILNERKRQTLPLSDLLIGMQCGGSDAFSGVTANPSAGYAADMLVKGGATVMFSEVTEVRDGVYLLGERCVNEEVGKKLAAEMKWYDNYLDAGKVDRSANPTPGNKKGGLADIVCGPCQLASGIGLQVFMTGRGTPYGLAIAPVIKVCSRNEMKEQWPDLIDINAGPVATGEATIKDIGTELFMKIIDVASGRDQSFAEKYKLHNDLCIFNPAPIT